MGLLYISAIKRNSGKTTISIAITRLLVNSGLTVQPFKKGPDFIDPIWLSVAAKRKCFNLDFFSLDKEKLLIYFNQKSFSSDISIIEGNHGLFDDINLYGATDNATLSKLLKSQIILVLDVKEMGRSIVPIIKGCIDFDKEMSIAGVILNRVQNERHKNKLVDSINYYTDLPVVAAIPEDEETIIPMRHLGLTATADDKKMEEHIDKITKKLGGFIDANKLIEISRLHDKLMPKNVDLDKKGRRNKKNSLKIGIAYDKAFNFYYNDNINELENLAEEIIYFSPLNDVKLPEVDGIYIGGGFPELFAAELERNYKFRRNLKDYIEDGHFVYAECGGLLYLTKNIIYEGLKNEMVGIFEADSKIIKKPAGHGYTILKPNNENKKKFWFSQFDIIKGHEFHHAKLMQHGNIDFAFKIVRGYGVDGSYDGLIYKNVLASFTHIFAPGVYSWFETWLNTIKCSKMQSKDLKNIDFIHF